MVSKVAWTAQPFDVVWIVVVRMMSLRVISAAVFAVIVTWNYSTLDEHRTVSPAMCFLFCQWREVFRLRTIGSHVGSMAGFAGSLVGLDPRRLHFKITG